MCGGHAGQQGTLTQRVRPHAGGHVIWGPEQTLQVLEAACGEGLEASEPWGRWPSSWTEKAVEWPKGEYTTGRETGE